MPMQLDKDDAGLLVRLVVATTRGTDLRELVAEAAGRWGADELREVVLHCALYVGMPLAAPLNAVVEQRVLAGGGPPPTERVRPVEHKADPSGVFKQVMMFDPGPPSGCHYLDLGVLGFAFGEVWQRPDLSVRHRRVITIVSFAVNGAERYLFTHLDGAVGAADFDVDDLRFLADELERAGERDAAARMHHATDLLRR